MFITKPQYISLLFFLMVGNVLLAQELPKFKFGKIDKEELEITTCDIDTSAHAFFLFDVGESRIEYNQSIGFQIKFTRHCAIKILTKSAYDYASFKIPVYEATSSRAEEKVTKIKAVTYNLEEGKVRETDLDKKDIFTEEEDENWSNVSFTMPNVVEGSVIEVEYSITSDFLWNLPMWRFQYEIPSRWSILETNIPEYFNYSKEMKGYVPLYAQESVSKNDKIIFNTVTRQMNGGFSGVSHQYSNGQIDFICHSEIFASKDIPAFKSEAYIDAIENYTSAIIFELQSTRFPNQPIKTYTTTWEEIGRSLMEDEDFGKQLKAVKAAKDIVAELGLDGLSNMEKSKKIFKYVKNSATWNKGYTKFCSNVKQVFKEGVGTSGDINMMLINLLDAAGIEVHPVLLKTRYAGKLLFFHPSLSSLNYLIAAVKIDSETYLLDATEKEIPFGLIPERCINDKGLLVFDDGKFEWLDLSSKSYSTHTAFGEISINEDGELDVKLNNRRNGYLAFDRRQSLDMDKDEIIENFEKDHTGFFVEDYEITNLDKYEEYLQEEIIGAVSDKTTVAGDMMYFNPCLFEKFDENPFKLEERKYPVDFAYPLNNKLTFSFTVPENWTVESIPENITMGLPDNAGKFLYSIQQMGNRIIFNQSLTISNSIFLPQQYKSLKEFFRLLVDKQNEQIVLKKI
ncbi:DUF3858 domain-containing protein [Maribellus maritimus]|uniref:DUF3858 domain-containing protein n=1 Tax=Maribellus maritimus TaxID=2870838 RepID=UPI001EEB4E3E|nr:DUF3857 domain-containing protein [Maribellus maritimus]MCG6188637.1 DUF3857 domain-containing protein [Maribellus maritimus]